MPRSRKISRHDGCMGCNLANNALIVPVHEMQEKDYKKLGIDFWTSDFSDIFSNGT